MDLNKLHSQQSYRLDLDMMPDSDLNQLDDQIDLDIWGQQLDTGLIKY